MWRVVASVKRVAILENRNSGQAASNNLRTRDVLSAGSLDEQRDHRTGKHNQPQDHRHSEGPMQMWKPLLPLFPCDVAEPDETGRPDQGSCIGEARKHRWLQEGSAHYQCGKVAVSRDEIGQEQGIFPPAFDPPMHLFEMFLPNMEHRAELDEGGQSHEPSERVAEADAAGAA